MITKWFRNLFSELQYWFEFFRDKGFSPRFKILNLLSGDLLRIYLACCLVNIGTIKDYIARLDKDNCSEELLTLVVKQRIPRADKLVRDIFDI